MTLSKPNYLLTAAISESSGLYLGCEFEFGVHGTILAKHSEWVQNKMISLQGHWETTITFKEKFYHGQRLVSSTVQVRIEEEHSKMTWKFGHLMDTKFLQQWLAHSFSLIHRHTKHVPKAVCQRAYEQIVLLINLLQKTKCLWQRHIAPWTECQNVLWFWLNMDSISISVRTLLWNYDGSQRTPFNGQNVCFYHILFKGYIQKCKKLVNCVLVWKAHE